MPSSYTASARFTLQATGENNNTWGVILNNGVFQLVDDTINGRLGLTVSGTRTLTTALGATDEARMRFLDVTGGSGGTIAAPSVAKGYYVRNGAAGPVSLSAGGTVATFQPGEAGMAHTDGATFYRDSIGGLSIKAYVDQNIMASAITTPPILGHGGQVLSTDGVATNMWTSAITGPFSAAQGLTSGDGTNVATVTLNGAALQPKYVSIETAGKWRWNLGADQTNEAGANAGSNFFLNRVADDGVTQLGTALAIDRASGAATFGGALTAGATTLASANVTGTTTLGVVNTGNLGVTGTLNVTGTTALGTITATNLTVNGDAAVTNDLYMTRYIRFTPNGLNYILANGGSSSQIILQANGVNALTVSPAGVATSVGFTSNAGMAVNGGNLTVNGDIYAERTGAAANTGVIFLGNAGAYLYFDGATYNFNGGHSLNVTGGSIGSAAFGSFGGAPQGGYNNVGVLCAQSYTGGANGYAGHFYCPGGGWGALWGRVDATTQYLYICAYQGSVVGSITTSGTGLSFNTTSDERLKDFTGDYSAADASAIIQADPVRTFTWNDLTEMPGVAAVGWGAQTSYAVSPDLASPAADETLDENGKPNHLWGMDQGKRTPYLWAAMGAPGGILDRLATLEAQVAALMAQAPPARRGAT